MKQSLVVLETIEKKILLLRKEKVMIDSDLAELYAVTTKSLNQAVRRNQHRFPPDFMFQLTEGEKQEVVTNCYHLRKLKFSATLPYAFTEHGAIMLASVLNSPKAVEASIYVVRAFVRLRNLLASHRELAAKLKELEHRVDSHDADIQAIVKAIRQLMQPPVKKKIQIGFKVGEPKGKYKVLKRRT
jgi:hypothetical protein